MAETKRYYWIKLKEDFFQDDAISWIQEKFKSKSLKISRNYKHSVAYCKKIYQIVVRSWSNHCHGYRRNSNQRV